MPSKIWFVTFSWSEPWRELEGGGDRGAVGRGRLRGGRIHFLYGLLCNQESHVKNDQVLMPEVDMYVYLFGSKDVLVLQKVPPSNIKISDQKGIQT